MHKVFIKTDVYFKKIKKKGGLYVKLQSLLNRPKRWTSVVCVLRKRLFLFFLSFFWRGGGERVLNHKVIHYDLHNGVSSIRITRLTCKILKFA